MLELRKVNIYAHDRLIPTIVITYLNHGKKNEVLKDFKMWLRKDVSSDYDIIDCANKLYYNIKIFTKEPTEKDIFRTYQILFGNKKWTNYKILHEIIFDNGSMSIPPQKNYIEFTKDYMTDFVYKQNINYTKEVSFQRKDGLEKEKI